MAERNWRDEVEPLAAEGSEVLHCEWCAYSGKWVCLVRDSSDGEILKCHQGGSIILKAKSPTYRPYKYGEVSCGLVFRRKTTGFEELVTVVEEDNVFMKYGRSYQELFDLYTQLDGTPAGMPNIS